MWSIRKCDYLLRKKANIMFSKFLNLEPEKKERIINAAIKEFAQKGFEKASTNEIVKAAKISKGLLFHYFNNKKDLFLFLYDYSLEIFMEEFLEKIDLTEKDILLRMRQKALLKTKIIKKHPEIFEFIVAANCEESAEIKNKLTPRTQEAYTTFYGKIYEDIDITKFKEGIDIKKAINIINWTVEGIRNQEQEELRQHSYNETYYDEILAEMDTYTELLKKCFYKE
jgi:TetR/AcrR family transcriptional regulator